MGARLAHAPYGWGGAENAAQNRQAGTSRGFPRACSPASRSAMLPRVWAKAQEGASLSVTWLHVSDFHFRDGDGYGSDVVLRALVDSVGRYRSQGREVDLVFATGDIAQSGQPGQYDAATRFFDALLSVLGLPRERLFVVPGNHDVDRKLGVGLARTLRTREECDDYFGPAVPKPHATQKMRAFGQWFDGYFEGIRRFPTESSCGAVETLNIGTQALVILPINSALFSLDDTDHANLLIGRRCLDAALQDFQAAETAVKVVLLHHPLDWLSDVERSNIKAALHRHADVILRGHLHETDVETVVTTVGQALHIAAGAAYQTRRWPNRAHYATLTVDRCLRVSPIRYEDSPTEVWTTDPSVFPDDHGHQRSFTLAQRNGSGAVPLPVESVASTNAVRQPAARFPSNVASRGRTSTKNRTLTKRLIIVAIGLVLGTLILVILSPSMVVVGSNNTTIRTEKTTNSNVGTGVGTGSKGSP